MTMDPPPPVRIAGTTARVTLTACRKYNSKTARQSASGMSSSRLSAPTGTAVRDGDVGRHGVPGAHDDAIDPPKRIDRCRLEALDVTRICHRSFDCDPAQLARQVPNSFRA